LFARETSMTFGQWRQQARLLTASEQLTTGTKVVDVALNTGYSSPGAFAAIFKRQFGVAPSVFLTLDPAPRLDIKLGHGALNTALRYLHSTRLLYE
jgi:AraC-like DNA-binding protein